MRRLFPGVAALLLIAPTYAGNVTTNKPPASAAEPTIVTSQTLRMDYVHNVGTFEGNVLVIDPRITVRADRMIVKFVTGPTTNATKTTARNLKQIEAHGGVVITAEDKKAVSEDAVYTADDGKVVLTGNPQLEGADGTVSGERITFWRDDKRMDVESGTRLILYPDELKKKESKPKLDDTTEPDTNSPPAETKSSTPATNSLPAQPKSTTHATNSPPAAPVAESN